MRIKVLFFGEARQILNMQEFIFDFSGQKLKEFAEKLKGEFPKISNTLDNCIFAVNTEYRNADTELKDGDTVAIIPPVEGG